MDRKIDEDSTDELDHDGHQPAVFTEPIETEQMDDDVEADFLADLDAQELLNNRFFNQREQRQGARGGQRKQAEKMLESSNKR